jgi:hypothetical protein
MRSSNGIVGIALLFAAPLACAELVAHTIAEGIGFGYQVLATDLNRDGRPDIIALGARMPELVWFENPGWERHVITGEAASMINMDAADTDGDGIPEIGLAYGFSTVPTRSTGNIAILRSAGDPTEPWTLTEIDQLPASHRLRFGDIEGNGRKVLINAPLANASAATVADPEQRPTPLVYYAPGDWSRTLITDQNLGAVHGLLVWDADGDGRDAVLTAGRFGVFSHLRDDSGIWQRSQVVEGVPAAYPDGGSSDLSAGEISGRPFFAAIEPYHGNQVVVYRPADSAGWQRLVIDTELQNGHSLVVADFTGDGIGEIVAAGTRGPKNLYFYRAADAEGSRWERRIIDDAIAANSCVAADIDGNDRIDLACIETSAPNAVKWYENTGSW